MKHSATFLSVMTLLIGLPMVEATEVQPNAPITTDTLYQDGKEAYDNQQYVKAVNLFNQVKKEGLGPHTETSYLGIIQSYIKMERFHEAGLEFADFMYLYPNSHYSDEVSEIQKVLEDNKQLKVFIPYKDTKSSIISHGVATLVGCLIGAGIYHIAAS